LLLPALGAIQPDERVNEVAYMVTNGAGEDDPRDVLDALRARIRGGALSRAERDHLDHLVVGVAVAGQRADTAAREFPGEVAMQRVVSAGAWATVAAQLRVLLGQGAGRLDSGPQPGVDRARP
jgi:DNA-binding NarL/FixJ family response regulator